MKILENSVPNRLTIDSALSARESLASHRTLPVVDDRPSSVFTLYDVINLQFWIHVILNTRELEDKHVNDYTGRIVDGRGFLPLRDDHPMLHPVSKAFRFGPRGMPHMEFHKPDGTTTHAWVTGDINRSTENNALANMHHLYAAICNKLFLDYGMDIEHAREMTLAVMAGQFAQTFEKYGIDVMVDPLPNVRVDLVNTMEFAFGWGRWVHSQVPALPSLFAKQAVSDPNKLLETIHTPAKVLGASISSSMAEMTHLPPPQDIRKRTGGHVPSKRQNSFPELATMIGSALTGTTLSPVLFPDDTPTWLGILRECRDDELGPVGKALVGKAAHQSFACEHNQLLHMELVEENLYGDLEQILQWLGT